MKSISLLKAISVAIFIVCKGYPEAKNKFLQSCDANKPTLYVVNLDANNLNGHSIMRFLATEILDWVYTKDFNLANYSNDTTIGCFVEVVIIILIICIWWLFFSRWKNKSNRRNAAQLSITNHRR